MYLSSFKENSGCIFDMEFFNTKHLKLLIINLFCFFLMSYQLTEETGVEKIKKLKEPESLEMFMKIVL